MTQAVMVVALVLVFVAPALRQLPASKRFAEMDIKTSRRTTGRKTIKTVLVADRHDEPMHAQGREDQTARRTGRRPERG